MSQWINTYLFGIYPYICLSVFLIGSLIRFDREQYTWRSGSSQLLRRRQLSWGSNLFHVGILVILIGHTGGLLTPVVIFEMLGISHTAKQLTAIVVGGVSGIMCLAGLLLLLHRRLLDPRIRRTSSFADIAVLIILLVQHLAARRGRFRRGCIADLQGTSCVGHDHLSDLPVHPPGSCSERAHLVSGPARLSDRANQTT
jgi:nitrate reductase gamma subunit